MQKIGYIPPMKPQAVKKPPEAEGWVHEIKYDGYRTQIAIEEGVARAFSSSGIDWSDRYRPLIEEAEILPCISAVIDGEVVVNDENGVSVFGQLPKAIKRAPHTLIFMAFDLLYLDGDDLRSSSLLERKDRLQELLEDHKGAIRYSEHMEVGGQEFFEACERLGLEGMVSKRADAPYRSGTSRQWVKIKCYVVEEFNVIGTKHTRTGEFVAMLQSRETGEYAGVAFVNLKKAERRQFGELTSMLRSEEPTTSYREKDARWLKPGIIASVRHLRGEESLRHASIMGIRADAEAIGGLAETSRRRRTAL